MSAKNIGQGSLLILLSLTQAACSIFGVRSEENPRYEVVVKADNKEVRSYQPFVVAKTTVKGEFRQAQNDAFRILAGYIFGKNTKKQKIAMTAPVTQTKESEKIAMTAPVTVQGGAEQGWVMTFMMPSQYKLEDLPTPDDARVQFDTVPARMVGVIRYSGTWSESNQAKQAEELKAWLATMPTYEITSGPAFAGYDPPWTLPFMRRNEVMFELRKK